jgi:NhaP-type Na+/H+ or K+/H+ antiporter
MLGDMHNPIYTINVSSLKTGLIFFLTNAPLQITALFGAMITSTGPNVVGPITRNIRVCLAAVRSGISFLLG